METLAVVTDATWAPIILQLGFGGVALWMLYKFGNKFVTQSDALIKSAMAARDKDAEKSREERVAMSANFMAALSEQREAFTVALSQQREAFTLALANRDVATAQMASTCHRAQDEASTAVRELATVTAGLKTAVQESLRRVG